MTCIHVSNIALKVTDTDLKELFEKYGQVENVKICMEPKTYLMTFKNKVKEKYPEVLDSSILILLMMLMLL